MADDARLQVEISAKIDKLIDGLNKAEQRIGRFSQAAYGAADRVRKAFDISQSRIDGPLKLIELQNKLTAAQIAGNKAEASALKEEITLLNTINTLRRQGLTQTEAQAVAERHVATIRAAEALAARAESAPNVGRAVRDVFDSARLATLEEGGTRLRLFGNALEPLGPYGLAAAAGVAALALASERAAKSAEWAESIKQASDRLGVSTTALQEWDFALASMGIGAEKGRASLDGLNQVVGRVEENLLRGKNAPQLRLFEQILGTDSAAATQEKLKTLGGLPGILAEIQRYVAPLNAQQRGAVAKVLEIDPQVLTSLADAKDKVGDLIQKAHEFGVIADRDLIDKGAEAAEKFHLLSTVIDTEMKGAFIGLATPLANAELGLLHVAIRIGDVIRGARASLGPLSELIGKLKSIPVFGTGVQVAQQPGILGGFGKFVAGGVGGPLGGTLAGLTGPARAIIGAWAKIGEQQRQFRDMAGQSADIAASMEGEGGGGGPGVSDLPLGNGHKGSKGAADDSAARLAAAQEALIRAKLQGANDLGAEHQLHLDLIAAEYAAAAARAQSEKNPKTRGLLLDAAAATQAANIAAEQRRYDEAISKVVQSDLAAATDRLTADRKAADAADESVIRTLGYERDRLEALRGIAKTTKDRKALAEQLLDVEQQQARLRLGIQARDDGTSPTAALASLDAVGAAKQTGIDQQFAGPLGKFADDAKSVSLSEELQTNVVTAMTSLNSGLAEAIVNGKSFGDTLKSALKQAEGDLLQWGLKQIEGSLFSGLSGGAGGVGGILSTLLHFIPGFAGGTESAPGGLAVVGEHGRELVNLPRGSQVIPNHSLSSLRAGGRGVVNLSVVTNNDLRGNSSTQEVQAMLAASEQRTRATVLDAARRSMAGWQVQGSYEHG